MLAGIYVANFERVSRFWPSPEIFDDFVAEHCNWSEPRWATWQRWDYEMRKAKGLRLTFRLYLGRAKKRLVGRWFKLSSDLQRLFEMGEKLTPHSVSERGRMLPLLTPEVMLLAFARTQDIPIGRLLLESGLLVQDLEQAAQRHIEHPEKLMF